MIKKYLVLCLVIITCFVMLSIPYFSNDMKAKSDHMTELHGVDSDGDHLPDYREMEIGTDPLNIDSDNDLMNDIDEVYLGTSPIDWDTDNDNMADGHELGEHCQSTSPFLKDTDCDGLPDPWEDNDGDGLLNREEQLPIHDGLCFYTDPFHDPPEERPATSPNDADSDNDGWNDGYEVQVNGTHTGANAVNPPPPVDRKNNNLNIAKSNSWATQFLTAVGWDAGTFADWRSGLKQAGNYNLIPKQCTNISWYHFSPWYLYEQMDVEGTTGQNFTNWKQDFFHSTANQTIRSAWDRGSPYDWNKYDCDPTLNDTDGDVMDDNWDPYPLRINLRNGTYAAINWIQPVGKSKVIASTPNDPDWDYFGRDVSVLELGKGDLVDINLSVGFQECSPDNVSHTNFLNGYFNPMQVVIRFRQVHLGQDGKAHSGGDDDWNFTSVAHVTRTFTNVLATNTLPGMKEVNFTNHLGIDTTITFYYQTFRIRIPSRVPAGHIAITVETECTDNFHYFPSDQFLVY